MFIPKLEYMQIPEKGKSTDGTSDYTISMNNNIQDLPEYKKNTPQKVETVIAS